MIAAAAVDGMPVSGMPVTCGLYGTRRVSAVDGQTGQAEQQEHIAAH